MLSKIEQICAQKNIKLTKNRKIIAQVISESKDHPDVEELLARVSKINPDIGIATIYRTMKIFEEEGIISKHDFLDGKARYEEFDECDHHDHLIDVVSGDVVEFYDEDLEKLKEKVAKSLGYELVDHRLELYAKPIK